MVIDKLASKFKVIALWAGILILFFILSYALLSSLSIEQVDAFDHLVMDLSLGFLILRWTLFFLLMLYWQEVITWLARKKQWSEAHFITISNKRWQVIALFITLEVIFNHRSYLHILF